MIMVTLQLIQKGEYDYDAAMDRAIKMPVDLSEYALSTKPASTLQTELLETAAFLGESGNSPEEWLEFLGDDEYAIYHRLCRLSTRLLAMEEKRFGADDVEQKGDGDDDQKDDDQIDEDLLSPMSTLCQLLAMFGSLRPPDFVGILRSELMANLVRSLRNHSGLNSEDVTVRLQTLIFVMTHSEGPLTVDQGADGDGDGLWVYRILVALLHSEYDPVLTMATKCIAFWVATRGDVCSESVSAKQKELLLFLKDAVAEDVLTGCTERFFAICNEAEWDGDELETKWLVDFVRSVMLNQVDGLFFSSDLKVLVDVFERTLHHQNVEGKALLWCVCGVETLFQWKGYDDELGRYRHEELCQELQSCIEAATENDLFEIAGKMDQVMRILN